MSGNGRPKAEDIAPKIRKSFVRAIRSKGGSEYLDRLMTESLERDFISTLNALAKFNPKTTNVNRSNTLQINIDASVTGWVEGFQAGSKAEALAHKPTEAAAEPVYAAIDVNPTLPYTLDIEDADTDDTEPAPAKQPDYPPIAQADPADLAKMRSR